ncbi:DUF3592 domain-containing protein [Streptomyces sp. NPDC093085]|uniref:DUF3592 domain-containing protein n=1 Tax=Streptomyces sp. NPDC093085 TaxID=3155068 RepID=UPI00344A8C5E
MGIEALFLLVGLLALAVSGHFARRVLMVLVLLGGGRRAEGRCVDRRTVTTSGVASGNAPSSHPEFVFTFRTEDGTAVEFKDRPGMFGYEVGAPVRVSYDPKSPRKRATIAGPGTWGPVYVPALICLGAALFAAVPLLAVAAAEGLF